MFEIWTTKFAKEIITARKRSFWQGNIFTPVCHSVHSGGGAQRGSVPGEVPGPGEGGAWWRPPGWLLLRVVRILLECILVSLCFALGPKNVIQFGLLTNYATAQLFKTEINSSSIFYINALNATKVRLIIQGGHGTGKTGNLVLTFSRQGKHRELCSNTGKNLLTQGKYLDYDY